MSRHRGGVFSRRRRNLARWVAWVMVAAMALTVIGSALAILQH